jgi:cytochrome c-type biogenesis protein CcmE
MDRDGRPFAVDVVYTSPVPDPFREGREVSVIVKQDGNVWRGEKDSLVTKCPSKYTAA